MPCFPSSCRELGCQFLSPLSPAAPVRAAGPEQQKRGGTRRAMSRSSSVAPCSLRQRAEQDGPDPCRDLCNLAGCAINRQCRGGSGSPPRCRSCLQGLGSGDRGRSRPERWLGVCLGSCPCPSQVLQGINADWGGGTRGGHTQHRPPPHCSRSSAERSCARIALLPCLHGEGPFFLCSCSPLGRGCGL